MRVPSRCPSPPRVGGSVLSWRPATRCRSAAVGRPPVHVGGHRGRLAALRQPVLALPRTQRRRRQRRRSAARCVPPQRVRRGPVARHHERHLRGGHAGIQVPADGADGRARLHPRRLRPERHRGEGRQPGRVDRRSSAGKGNCAQLPSRERRRPAHRTGPERRRRRAHAGGPAALAARSDGRDAADQSPGPRGHEGRHDDPRPPSERGHLHRAADRRPGTARLADQGRPARIRNREDVADAVGRPGRCPPTRSPTSWPIS